MLASIREFFAEAGVTEVETPSLGHAIGTDPHLDFFSTEYRESDSASGEPLYLQTSPEFAMKRLLAAGCGSIYQICKAFRNRERGRLHNPEFSMLEWYREGIDLHGLIDDVERLLGRLFQQSGISLGTCERIRYRDIFLEETGIDLSSATVSDFRRSAAAKSIDNAADLCGDHQSLWIDLLFSHLIQPALGRGRLTFIYEYPRCQAALAKISRENPDYAQRMEVFYNGIELGNGYDELTDADEQLLRFDDDNAYRAKRGLNPVEADSRLIEALRSGLPPCSGVAVGLDRLLMIMTAADSIDQVLAFPYRRA